MIRGNEWGSGRGRGDVGCAWRVGTCGRSGVGGVGEGCVDFNVYMEGVSTTEIGAAPNWRRNLALLFLVEFLFLFYLFLFKHIL